MLPLKVKFCVHASNHMLTDIVVHFWGRVCPEGRLMKTR